MKKIICVTLNPAMDKTIFVNNYKEGCVNLIDEVYYEIGGKGINVAKVLNNFEIKCIVTGFVGGIWTDKFRTKLMKLGIETKFFKLLQDTRINTKLIDTDTGMCTAINEKGPFVPEEVLEKFIQSFTLMCHAEDLIVLTGTPPPGVPKNIYYTLTQIAKKKGATVILDAHGEALLKALDAKPDMIKISYRDFIPKEYWGKLTKADFPYIIQKVRETQIQNALISLGQYGALFVDQEKNYYANAVQVGVDLKYPVGAGDAMVAALIIGKLEEFDLITTIKYAIACGAACVVAKDTSNCKPTEVNKYISEVVVNELTTY
ncbi:1-phosphofructokinase family hexose kinase [Cellulosilyticum sp. I15G10I2]|uniref:1-phosphofructokinase family hexose kinase n=1 Tax=Cellulosilyticum sp. I15G10I2 TaxID=1892843 RepID=UPI00085C4A3B|nr:1-phosphofructokinase [Cellulosilyticum sp. I15G10I2]